MGPTEWFLIVWIVAPVVWQLVALVNPTDSIEPISRVLSRLPTWAVLLIVVSFAVLSVHWWFYDKSPEYRNFFARLFQ